MDIKIDSLILFDTLRTDLERVLSVVEKNGKIVFLKDNKPAYILSCTLMPLSMVLLMRYEMLLMMSDAINKANNLCEREKV